MINTLLKILTLFAAWSLLALGGGNAVIPAMQHTAVDVQHWMNDREFLDLFAISRLSPGPGSLIAPLIGWQVAGVLGALVAAVGMYGPSCLLVHIAAGVWQRTREATWRDTAERGLAPLAVGLVFASGIGLVRGTEHSLPVIAVTAAAAAALALTEMPPIAVLAAGGVVGWLAGF